MSERAFQVDLGGLVDLLSSHLYSGPHVYVRELLQNAVDAVTARRSVDEHCDASIEVRPADVGTDGMLAVVDTGIGLTLDEVGELLATIGGTSKRDPLGFGREDFLGQFGIGLLSCFLVTDEVQVVTRSAAPDQPAVMWLGRSSGVYEARELADDESDLLGLLPAGGVGTSVMFRPRVGRAEWTTSTTVLRLAQEYGELLPMSVRVVTPDGGSVDVTAGEAPWDRDGSSGVRRAALLDHARRHLDPHPFEVLPVEVPEAGLKGVAAILGRPSAAGARQSHRVYLKGMLLGAAVDGLAPDWAFFVRFSVSATQLRPTASREALYEDELLQAVRESLGSQVRQWLTRLAATDPDRLGEFLSLHQMGVKALALHDDELLRVILPWLPFETTLGWTTLAEFRRTFPEVRYTSTVDEFRQISAVAAAQGIGVVNGGYAYDAELIQRFAVVEPEAVVELMAAVDLDSFVEDVDSAAALELRGPLSAVRSVLDRLGCDAELRQFDPITLPSLYLDDRDRRHRRESRRVNEESDALWAEILGVLDDGREGRPRLLLNYRNPTVHRVLRLEDPRLLALAVESLYCQALLLGHHPLRPVDSAALNRAFLGLLEWSVDAAPGPDASDGM